MVSDRSSRNIAAPALQVDLLELLAGLLAARWWLVGATLAFAGLAGAWISQQPDRYEAVVRVGVVDPDDPGGVSPDDRRAPEVLTLVEHGFVLGGRSENHRYVTLAKLRSREFTLRFMDEFNVFRHFHPEHWDTAGERWVDGFVPDRGAAFKRFHEQVRFIREDEVTGIVSIAMRWTDPVVGRDWANAYVALFNTYARQTMLAEVRRRQAFLEAELVGQPVVELQQSIYRLVEAQTAVAMLAKGREEYALDVIDPATRPYDRHSPARKRAVIYGAVAGAMLSTFAVLALMFLGRVRQALATLEPPCSEEVVA